MIEILRNFMSNKNAEISTKSSEIICLLKDKIIIDLFKTSNKNVEDLFSESKNTLIIENSRNNVKHSINYRKHSINPSPNLKNQRQIIEELEDLITNKSSMYQIKNLTPEKNRQIIQNERKNIIASNFLIVETLYENEKFEQKDFSSGINYTSTTTEVKTHKFFENEFVNINNDQQEKDKILNIFNEMKDKYFQKKENSIQSIDIIKKVNAIVYATKLDKDQIYNLFSKYFDKIYNNAEEFFDFLKEFLNNETFLGKKKTREKNESEKKLQSTFYMRRGICQHLSKIINKIVFILFLLRYPDYVKWTQIN